MSGIATAQQIQARLTERLAPSYLIVVDESASHAGHAGTQGLAPSGTHFRVQIGSAQFAGRSRVAQHRLVYDALHDFLAGGVHALAIEIL